MGVAVRGANGVAEPRSAAALRPFVLIPQRLGEGLAGDDPVDGQLVFGQRVAQRPRLLVGADRDSAPGSVAAVPSA